VRIQFRPTRENSSGAGDASVERACGVPALLALAAGIPDAIHRDSCHVDVRCQRDIQVPDTKACDLLLHEALVSKSMPLSFCGVCSPMVAVSSAQHFHGTLLQITLAHRGVLPCSGKSSSQRVGGQRGLGTENRILALLPAIFELTNRKQKMVVECCARLACDETKAGPLFVACRTQTQTPRGKMGTGTGIKCRNHRGETQSRANRLLVKPVDDDGWGTSATFRGALYPSKH
jgi:hypothetical protein